MAKLAESYRALYRMMQTIRLTEESFVDPILNKEIRCPVHLCSGQEAVAAGVCSNLKNSDLMFGNHRSHGHFLAKGGSIQELVSEVYCKEDGCARGRGGSMHLINREIGFLGSAPIVGGTISLATGAALAESIRKTDNVVVSFFGDGATGEGTLYESLNFAQIKKLPIIFICENNLYSTHMGIGEIRGNVNIYESAKSFGLTSLREDGNNVIKVEKAFQKAAEQCRSGKGPVFLEFLTYRLMGHVGPNDNVQGTMTDIRPAEELEVWKKNDPILNFRNFLLSNESLNKEEIKKIDTEIINKVEKAHQNASKSRSPSPEEITKYVYQD
jgi:acetoin:2,6-dichlorophenolindophenol oxidoreductase subunit alpha